jgi:hypothetical protein
MTALANFHLATAPPNSLGVEVVRGFVEGYYRGVLDKPFSVDHGHLVAPARPGLGAALAPGSLSQDEGTIVSSTLNDDASACEKKFCSHKGAHHWQQQCPRPVSLTSSSEIRPRHPW